MISIKLFAGTDVGLRDNNEDNFIVCPDLTKNEWMVPADQQDPIPLGPRGCLIVVADGMGGMNAGEVASDIAVKTVKQMFAPEVLASNIVESPESVKDYLKTVIVQADSEVKKQCKANPETEGMGSTIILAWLLENHVYVGWLGDSRAYSFKADAEEKIIRLSKDHSYVQQLVDAKILTEEEAMNHPNSNIVVRSLGDTSQKAKPDVADYPVSEGEIIMLCSDGLCGVCTDKEIANIIEREIDDLPSCKEALTTAALAAGGSDNITIALLQIARTEKEQHEKTVEPTLQKEQPRRKQETPRKRMWLWVGLLLLVYICVLFVWQKYPKCVEKKVEADSIIQPPSSSTKKMRKDGRVKGENTREDSTKQTKTKDDTSIRPHASKLDEQSPNNKASNRNISSKNITTDEDANITPSKDVFNETTISEKKP